MIYRLAQNSICGCFNIYSANYRLLWLPDTPNVLTVAFYDLAWTPVLTGGVDLIGYELKHVAPLLSPSPRTLYKHIRRWHTAKYAHLIFLGLK